MKIQDIAFQALVGKELFLWLNGTINVSTTEVEGYQKITAKIKEVYEGGFIFASDIVVMCEEIEPISGKNHKFFISKDKFLDKDLNFV